MKSTSRNNSHQSADVSSSTVATAPTVTPVKNQQNTVQRATTPRRNQSIPQAQAEKLSNNSSHSALTPLTVTTTFQSSSNHSNVSNISNSVHSTTAPQRARRSNSLPSLNNQNVQPEKSGVLYKRRDVFRNHWRPRFFILHRDTGLLDYYLLRDASASKESEGLLDDSMTEIQYQKRFLKEVDVSKFSNSTPRGSFFLPGCASVFVNEKLSKNGKYYAFTLVVSSNSVGGDLASEGNLSLHLATLTESERTSWVQKLSHVCNEESDGYDDEEEDDGASSAQSSDVESEYIMEYDTMNLMEDVPLDIQTLIDEKVRRVLHFFRESTGRGNRWKPCFRKQQRVGIKAFQKHQRGAGLPPYLRVESFSNHHPCLLLLYLLDMKKRLDFETGIRLANRLKVLNDHTYLDYIAYKPIKPIASRDFYVVTHWRVLPNQSILYLSFSSPEQKSCPLDLDHVRGNLIVSAYLFQPTNHESCFVKHLVAADLNGKIPKSVVTAFTLQQAMRLFALNNYLEKMNPQPTIDISEISNGAIVSDILGPILEKDKANTPKRGFSKDSSVLGTGLVLANSTRNLDAKVLRSSSTSNLTSESNSRFSFPFWLILAFGLLLFVPWLCVVFYTWILIPIYQHILFVFFLPLTGLLILQNFPKSKRKKDGFATDFPFFIDGCVLLFPVVAFHLATNSAPESKESVFVLSLFLSIRSFVLAKLGPRYTYADGTLVPVRCGHTGLGTGFVTCRFNVELKGILRFISQKKDQRKKREKKEDSEIMHQHNINPKDAEIAVTHIVIKAAAKAISEFPVFNGYSLEIPCLSIAGYFPFSAIDISVAKGIHRSSCESNHTSKLRNVNELSITEIAMQVAMKISPSSRRGNLVSAGPSFLSFTSFILYSKRIMKYFFCAFGLGALFVSKFGSCVILTSPNSENSDVEIDVAPNHYSLNSPNVIITVGGVRVLQQPTPIQSYKSAPNHRSINGSNSSSSSSGQSRPYLQMSITMNCPAASIATCRKFAERIQKLVQLPELSDENEG